MTQPMTEIKKRELLSIGFKDLQLLKMEIELLQILENGEEGWSETKDQKEVLIADFFEKSALLRIAWESLCQ